MYGTSENPDRRRKKNTANVNGRTGFAGSGATVHSVNGKNEGHRLSGAGRLDNALNEMKPSLLNRTRINSIVFKPNLSKPNELLNTADRVLFESGKNASGRLQPNNGHQPNTVVSNELGLSIYNPPDNAIDTTHTSNHQLTDQEPFGTNDIDKSECARFGAFCLLSGFAGSASADSFAMINSLFISSKTKFFLSLPIFANHHRSLPITIAYPARHQTKPNQTQALEQKRAETSAARR